MTWIFEIKDIKLFSKLFWFSNSTKNIQSIQFWNSKLSLNFLHNWNKNNEKTIFKMKNWCIEGWKKSTTMSNIIMRILLEKRFNIFYSYIFFISMDWLVDGFWRANNNRCKTFALRLKKTFFGNEMRE
jgi:hypothetical protein